jgi:hypothetical protein
MSLFAPLHNSQVRLPSSRQRAINRKCITYERLRIRWVTSTDSGKAVGCGVSADDTQMMR